MEKKNLVVITTAIKSYTSATCFSPEMRFLQIMRTILTVHEKIPNQSWDLGVSSNYSPLKNINIKQKFKQEIKVIKESIITEGIYLYQRVGDAQQMIMLKLPKYKHYMIKKPILYVSKYYKMS